ncbi:MAG: FG-GAP repeat domain-containing protein, partial [Cyanobacteriota bacterium]
QLTANPLSLNGSTIRDAAGNDAVLTFAQPGAIGSLASNQNIGIDGSHPTGSTRAFITTDLSYVGSDVGSFASPAFADVDNDGDLDLFIGERYGNTVFYRNTAAAGATAPACASPITNPFGIIDVGYDARPTFADVDNDGDLDLFIGNWYGNTVFYRNTAAAGATAPAYASPITNPFGITDVGYGASPTLADVDGDGDLDLFIGNNYGNTVFYRNTAAAGATAPAYASPITNPFGITDVGYHASPTFADIDGDRDLDLFIGTTYGTTDFYRNTAAAGATAPAYDLPITNPFGISLVNNNSSPTFVDVDLDGDLDLFAGDWLGETFFFRNIATSAFTDPSFGEPIVCPFGITDVGYSAKPAFADADTDGDLDLFIGDGYGNTVFYRNTAAAVATAPAYASPITNPFGITDVGYAASPTFGDVDGDRDFDLFIGTSYGNTVFFRNTTVTSPPIIKITSINPNGIYGIGAVITLNAQFSKAVFVNTALGSPTLALETGMKDHVATYVNGSGTNTLVFQYIVQAGDHAPILDQLSANALSLNGSIILDAAGNIPSLTLAEAGTIGSLSANKNLAIDGTNPTGSTPGFIRTGLSYVGSDVGPNASPAFADVDTDGDLDLFIGNWYGNTVFYRNTAAAGATAPAYAAPIKNPFGITDYGKTTLADVDNDGDFDLFVGKSSGNTLFLLNSHIIPITSSNSSNGSYGIGSLITLTIEFSEAVFVNTSLGTPTLALETGSTDRAAVYDGGSGGTTLSFRYIVQAGDYSIDLDQLSADALSLNGGTIRDAAGNDAVLTFAQPGAYGSLSANANIIIDTTAPSGIGIFNPFGITDVGDYASPAFADVDTDGDLDLFIGEEYGRIVFYRNTAAAGATAPAYDSPINNPFGITDVGSNASPAFADVDNDGDFDLFIGEEYGNTVFFLNTAAAGVTAPAYASPITNPFGITDFGYGDSPTLADVDGDGDLDLFIGELYGNTLFLHNSPIIQITSSNSNGSYGIGSVITLTLQFSEPVFVNTSLGTPTLALETGTTDRAAVYDGGSGSTTL